MMRNLPSGANGVTPFHLAIMNNNTALIEFMLKNGARLINRLF